MFTSTRIYGPVVFSTYNYTHKRGNSRTRIYSVNLSRKIYGALSTGRLSNICETLLYNRTQRHVLFIYTRTLRFVQLSNMYLCQFCNVTHSRYTYHCILVDYIVNKSAGKQRRWRIEWSARCIYKWSETLIFIFMLKKKKSDTVYYIREMYKNAKCAIIIFYSKT